MKILEVKNLRKSFDHKSVHRDISFHLSRGETIGLLGKSGTGKSVLLRSLIGLETIDAGEIIYQGQRIDDLTEEDLYPIRTKISYSFQNGALFDSDSIFDNLAFPLREHSNLSEHEIEVLVKKTLSSFNLDGIEELKPMDLSGGMQKRVGLARSIILKPDVILYDEPTAGLDPLNVEMVIQLMKELKRQNFSGIFVTHDIPAAKKICDRMIIIKDGEIGFNDTVEAFEKSNDPFVKNFLMS